MARILFMAISLTIQGALYYYVWRRLAKDTLLPAPWSRMGTLMMAASFLLFPLAMWSHALGVGYLATPLGWFVFPTMAFVGLSAGVLMVIDLGRIAMRWRARRSPPAASATVNSAATEAAIDLDRRAFFARATGASAVALVGGSMAHGANRALGEPTIERIEIELARWPSALAGLTIAHITDLHAGFTIDRGYVERVVARTNALSPDLIFLTGDLVDGRVHEIGDRTAPLAELRARLGVFGVTGNHEYYSGAEEWLAEFRRLGIRMLHNEHVVVADREQRFVIAGIDDSMGSRALPGHGPDIKAAMRGAPRDIPSVLLAHQPKQIRYAIFRNLDLQVSGHTHGGQVWPWHYLASLQQGGYLAGLYEKNGTKLYVGRGCGYWGPPVRVGAPPEIGLLTLMPPRQPATLPA